MALMGIVWLPMSKLQLFRAVWEDEYVEEEAYKPGEGSHLPAPALMLAFEMNMGRGESINDFLKTKQKKHHL